MVQIIYCAEIMNNTSLPKHVPFVQEN